MKPTNDLKVGRDYNVQNGKFVFTGQYLLRRGYCCGNGCKNCPYVKAVKTTLKDIDKKSKQD